jgi:hypothetical protein
MNRTLEIIYTYPSGKKEVHYRVQEGTAAHDTLKRQILLRIEKDGEDSPYSLNYFYPKTK